jgi:hypothetical protein
MVSAGRKGSPIMASADDIESAKLHMLEARKALEECEKLNGFAPSPEHTRLTQAFTKATEFYLRISKNQP